MPNKQPMNLDKYQNVLKAMVSARALLFAGVEYPAESECQRTAGREGLRLPLILSECWSMFCTQLPPNRLACSVSTSHCIQYQLRN